MSARRVLFVSMLFPFLAQGGELSETYRHETLQVLRGLQKNGVSQIGCEPDRSNCLYVEDLIQNILSGEVKWKELSHFQKPSGATRLSAFNAPALKTVFLNQSVQEVPGTVGLIGFHEVIGLYGKDDRGFHVSTAAGQILDFAAVRTFEDQQTDHIVFDRLKEAIRRSPAPKSSFEPEEDKLLMESGGAVIGGGGGDTRTLSLRLQVYDVLRKDLLSRHRARGSQGGLSNAISAFYQYYGQLPIDLSRTEGTSIKYEFDDLKLPQITRVVVPQNLFESARDTVVKEITLMYSSIGMGQYLFSALGLEMLECFTPDKKQFQADRANLLALHPETPERYTRRLKEDQALIATHPCRKLRE